MVAATAEIETQREDLGSAVGLHRRSNIDDIVIRQQAEISQLKKALEESRVELMRIRPYAKEWDDLVKWRAMVRSDARERFEHSGEEFVSFDPSTQDEEFTVGTHEWDTEDGKRFQLELLQSVYTIKQIDFRG